MAQLGVQKVSQGGTKVTLVAAAGGGDTFPASMRRALRVKNGGGSGITVTIHSQKPCSQGVVHDVTGPVAAGDTEEFGPFDPNRFADASGLVHVTYSGVTTVTVGCVEQ